jgi:hypothetical protein
MVNRNGALQPMWDRLLATADEVTSGILHDSSDSKPRGYALASAIRSERE